MAFITIPHTKTAIDMKTNIVGFQYFLVKLMASNTNYVWVKPPTIMPVPKMTPMAKFNTYLMRPFNDLSLNNKKKTKGNVKHALM